MEYSIGDDVEMVGRCLVALAPTSNCKMVLSDGAGLSTVTVGDMDGSVCVLGADASDASNKLKQGAVLSRERGRR